MSEEANLPTWWTGLLLVGAAGLHLQAGILPLRSGSRGAVSWWLLAALLAMLSLDELAGLHLEEFGEMAGAALAACSPLAALRLGGVGTNFGVYLAAS